MKRIWFFFAVIIFTFPEMGSAQNVLSLIHLNINENLSEIEKERIEAEINNVFKLSIKAGEDLNVNEIKSPINDELKTGFIDNGNYFTSFGDLMVGFEKRVQNLDSQKMTIVNKKITIFSNDLVLLTAAGNYSATLTSGQVFEGKFAWTFIYKRMNDTWKVVHSHMSNPR